MKSKFLMLAIAAMMMSGASVDAARGLFTRSSCSPIVRANNLADFNFGAQNFAVNPANTKATNIAGVTLDNNGVLIIDPTVYKKQRLYNLQLNGNRVAFNKITAIYVNGDINTVIDAVNLWAIEDGDDTHPNLVLPGSTRVIGQSRHGGFVAVALPMADRVFEDMPF